MGGTSNGTFPVKHSLGCRTAFCFWYGNRTTRSSIDKMSKYFRTTTASELDIRLLQANLAALRMQVGITDRVSAPNIFYDNESKQIKLLVGTRNYLNNETVESIRSSLPRYINAWYRLSINPVFPDVLQTDLIVEFTEIETGTMVVYKDGSFDFFDRQP